MTYSTLRQDITGKKWGKLTALSYSHHKGKREYWLFECDCGDRKICAVQGVRGGNTSSCGCLTTRKFKDLTGIVFTRLTVLSLNGQNTHGDWLWLCKCQCGNEVSIVASRLKRGTTRSCGCLAVERSHNNNFRTHGVLVGSTGKYPPLYSRWNHVKERCNSPNSDSYPKYGGRGITMYQPWAEDYLVFEAYCEEIEPYLYELLEQGYQIDRRINDSGYVPGNIRFVDRTTNARNKRNTIWVEYEGSTMSIRDAYDLSECKLKVRTVIYRFYVKGWNISDALSLPLYSKKGGYY